MIKRFSIISLLLTSLYIGSGCHKGGPAPTNEVSPVYNLANEAESLTDELGVYTHHFNNIKNRNINIRNTSSVSHVDTRFSVYSFSNTANLERKDVGDFMVGNIKFYFDGERYVTQDLKEEEYAYYARGNIFGKEVNFKNIENGDVVFNELLYIPKELLITAWRGSSAVEASSLIKFNRENVAVDYNVDERNSNGFIVLMSYRGDVHGQSLEDLQNKKEVEIFNAVHISGEETGELRIPSSLFREVPENGIVTLYIGRGNGKVIESGDESYYVRALSEVQIFAVVL